MSRKPARDIRPGDLIHPNVLDALGDIPRLVLDVGTTPGWLGDDIAITATPVTALPGVKPHRYTHTPDELIHTIPQEVDR